MDRIEIGNKLRELALKYRYVLLVLAVGLFLMCLPERNETEKQQPSKQTEANADLAVRLEEILGTIRGVGRVRVLLTERSGESVLYQTDTDAAYGAENSSERTDTVVITSEDRAESGLIRQINPPVYLGAVVVCQGGDDPTVRLAVVEAVSDATGLGADRISVLKMK